VENAREDDMDVNATKEKKQTKHARVKADEAIRLIPHRQLTLEQAIEFIYRTTSFVEVTPKAIRLRKKILDPKKRPRRWQIRANARSRAVRTISSTASACVDLTFIRPKSTQAKSLATKGAPGEATPIH